MTLSPFEVERREFGRGAWGYKPSEVDDFMVEVQTSLTELWQERGELRDQVEILTEKVQRFTSLEEQLKNTLLLAQESAEKATEQARREAELVLREAGQKAREIVHTAHEERQTLETALREMRSAEAESRQRFRALAQTVLSHLDETEPASPQATANLMAAVQAQSTTSMPAVSALTETVEAQATEPTPHTDVQGEPAIVTDVPVQAKVTLPRGVDAPESGKLASGSFTDGGRSPEERAQERARRMAARATRGTEEISDLAASMERQADIATAPLVRGGKSRK